MLLLFSILFLFTTGLNAEVTLETFTFGFPEVSYWESNEHYCVSEEIPDADTLTLFIRNLTVSLSMGTEEYSIHHVLLYACEYSALTGSVVYKCADGADDDDASNETEYDRMNHDHIICGGSSQLMNFWDTNAPLEFTWPDSMAARVGNGTKLKVFVLEIHNNVSGYSAGGPWETISYQTSTEGLKYEVGLVIQFLETDAGLSPHTYETKDMACTYTNGRVWVWGYLCHSHGHTLADTIYIVKNGTEWNQIGHQGGKAAQYFRISENPMYLENGHVVVGRCYYHNYENYTVQIGDIDFQYEMCVLALIYARDLDYAMANELDTDQVGCISEGMDVMAEFGVDGDIPLSSLNIPDITEEDDNIPDK